MLERNFQEFLTAKYTSLSGLSAFRNTNISAEETVVLDNNKGLYFVIRFSRLNTGLSVMTIHVRVCFIRFTREYRVPAVCHLYAHKKHFSTHPAMFELGLTWFFDDAVIAVCSQVLYLMWWELSLDIFFPPSQWMWILTFYFDPLKDVPLHDRLTLHCLFIFLFNRIVSAEMCVVYEKRLVSEMHSSPESSLCLYISELICSRYTLYKQILCVCSNG